MPEDAKFYEAMADFLAQLLATLTGALAAFELERRRRKREETKGNASGLRRALFALLLQREFLLNLKRQQLEPLRNSPMRTYKLHPIIATAPAMRPTISDVVFVLDGDGELLHQLINADDRVRYVVQILSRRSKLHRRMQQKLDAHEGEFELNAATLRVALGPTLDTHLHDLTNGLYRAVDDAWQMNEQAERKARDYARRVFPKERFFTVEDLPPSA